MTEGISKAFVVDLVPEEKRGTAIGIFYTATGLSTLIASSMAGFMWSYLGVSVPFLYGGVMAILAAILLLFLPKTL
jgi:predicted MFS family arabinose efflux permease